MVCQRIVLEMQINHLPNEYPYKILLKCIHLLQKVRANRGLCYLRVFEVQKSYKNKTLDYISLNIDAHKISPMYHLLIGTNDAKKASH